MRVCLSRLRFGARDVGHQRFSRLYQIFYNSCNEMQFCAEIVDIYFFVLPFNHITSAIWCPQRPNTLPRHAAVCRRIPPLSSVYTIVSTFVAISITLCMQVMMFGDNTYSVDVRLSHRLQMVGLPVRAKRLNPMRAGPESIKVTRGH